MSTMLLRGIDEETKRRLTEEAERQGVSLNTLALRCLQQSVGLGAPARRPRHHDLDALAGTWSEEEAREFLSAVSHFEWIEEGPCR